MDNLNIISFEKKNPLQSSFFSVLSQADYNVIKLKDSRLIQKLTSDQTDVNVFVFDDPSTCSQHIRQTATEIIKRNCLSTNLCLSYTLPATDCNAFFSYFDDLLFWPFEQQEFDLRIKRYRTRHKQSNSIFERKVFDDFASLNLIGRSTVFTRMLELIRRIAQYDAPVLIEGETGTGKENVARSIHHLSDRRNHNFVPLNCGAIQDNLFEAELFGHEKGAFTDAKTRQEGLVSIANEGTLFLDEVDCLSPKAQVALLRFLQTKEYRPVGSSRTYTSNLRILAATNADLLNNISHHQFREDLYFRLNVLNINLPALRERVIDIPIIAKKLLSDYSRQYGLSPRKLSKKSISTLMKQSWPGNIRELENVILRACLLSDDPIINIPLDQQYMQEHEELSKLAHNEGTAELKFQEAKSIVIQNFEQDYLSKILNITDGNITKAAVIAGKERRAIGKLIKKYNMDKRCFTSKSGEI
ncbi:DNA-binding transcriptional response regulator, NtrC family, contains REC, AAA-type ATPase, and a Fis-type DNA-binding domains [Nitrosomonas marina]|uniref:DNA-binding transcriptional response regulator, NtrC family, contains REC, AAA-type ATPase, and a Fis-type DNA-binding domains n=1 Tax=Nitrosomonas marina TaxID=917 RepID=A0A1I0BIX7_9PROT|nr:sigma-54 dependent transcriptional regulator [Nitrosomonas marina]SET06941.1 DNA-binding transcriptional response regulator, NtrC family, contains REC, AAA-type ATPase, and a Fis-type DNA-binding domains [Nitrosomonas marina]